jgi:acetone carboxylase alpha subunit
VLERDPALVMKDLAEDLMSHDGAEDIYRVVYDRRTLIVDEAATKAARDAERKARLARGKPFDQFVKKWVSKEPPAALPYFGCWDDPKVIYAGLPGMRIKMDADQLQGVFMPNPKDLRIMQLEAEVGGLQKQLANCQKSAARKSAKTAGKKR